MRRRSSLPSVVFSPFWRLPSITAYMIISGTPALFKVGIIDILFGTVWKPEAAVPAFGILYVILDFHCRNCSRHFNRRSHRRHDGRFPR